MRRINSLVVLLVLLFASALYSASGTPSNLIVKTDANNYLLVTSVTQTNPVTQGIFSSRTLRTDANGSLQVVLTGTVTPTYPQAIPASTCAAPSLGESGADTNGIAFTATPSILMCIAGSAIETITGSSVTYTKPLLGGDGLVSAPTFASSSLATTGLYFSNSGTIIRFALSGVNRYIFTDNALSIRNDGASIVGGAGDDTSLTRIAAGVWATNNNVLTTTSTDGFVVRNTTASTVGTPVQISPRSRLSGTGWDVDDAVSRTISFFTETLPVSGNTVSGTWKLGFIDPTGTTTYPLTVTSGGLLTTLGAIVSGGNISAPASSFINALTDGSGGGLRAGTGSDVLWYRNAADTWRTPDAVTIDGVVTFGSNVVTNAAIGVAGGYKIARGSTALDGSNPTTVATGLTTVVSCAGTLIRSTAVSSGTAFLTHAAASGANVDFYGWVIAGSASSGTENFEWVCVGT
jgi:hypothetical protein